MGVTAIEVSAEFVATSVLAADSADASPAARTGFGRLLDQTWQRLERRIRAAGGVAVGAAGGGGEDTLARLVATARQSDETPHGLWLLCPMPDPAGQPRLDNLTVGVIPGDAEQVVIPSGLVVPDHSRRAS